MEDDPKETSNMIDIEPAIAAKLESRIVAHIEFVKSSTPTGEQQIGTKLRKLKANGKV